MIGFLFFHERSGVCFFPVGGFFSPHDGSGLRGPSQKVGGGLPPRLLGLSFYSPSRIVPEAVCLFGREDGLKPPPPPTPPPHPPPPTPPHFGSDPLQWADPPCFFLRLAVQTTSPGDNVISSVVGVFLVPPFYERSPWVLSPQRQLEVSLPEGPAIFLSRAPRKWSYGTGSLPLRQKKQLPMRRRCPLHPQRRFLSETISPPILASSPQARAFRERTGSAPSPFRIR